MRGQHVRPGPVLRMAVAGWLLYVLLASGLPYVYAGMLLALAAAVWERAR